MLSYLIRRILLMIPTLIGITIMVFLIARLAPGRPGQMEIDGGGMSAEEQKALNEWYERRYGLDKNLFEQYLNWWQGMFTVKVQATAWWDSDGELLPVHTYRQAGEAFYAQRPNGTWVQLIDVSVVSEPVVQSQLPFRDELDDRGRALLPDVLPNYAEPTHVLIEADAAPIESLDDVRDAHLSRATRLIDVPVQAPAWTPQGEPIYLDPDSAASYLVQRDGQWLAYHPESTIDRWRVLPITDGQLRRELGDQIAELGQEALDDYAIPRHALVGGRIEPIDRTFSVAALERAHAETTATAPTGLWWRVENGDVLPVYQQPEPAQPMLVRDADGTWHQLIGDTRLDHPPAQIYRQTDAGFLSMLRAEQSAELGTPRDGQRVERHAVMAGRLVPLPGDQPAERSIRRHQVDDRIFEVTLGESIATRTTVMDELSRRLPVTLMISLIAFPLIYLIAIPCGMLMAVQRGRAFDTGANIVMLGLWSIPTVLSGTLVIGYLAMGGGGVEWFPNNGLASSESDNWPFFQWLLDRFWHLVLPIFCIVYGGFAYLAKQMRAAMLDNFTMDYVRTAKAKGVSYKDTIFRHVLRNSLLPLITIFATILPVLIAGSIIIERIFTIEGMGLMAFRAVQNRDYDVVQSLAMIAGVLNLIGLLIADIFYALADPRITYN